MFEVTYASARVARVAAADRESAKHGFAAYALYDDASAIESDVELSFGDDAEIVSATDPAPTGGTRDAMRAWLARRDAQAERFEPGLYEAPGRGLDGYLRLLATNDPWRLEGHGSAGRVLSAVPVAAELATFDGRVHYRFDAARYVDYLRLDTVVALDPARPQDSLHVDGLVDVVGLHDRALRQIASSYAAIVRELRLTQRYAGSTLPGDAFAVAFESASWDAYRAHRLAEPQRFLPPAGWESDYPAYRDGL